MNKHEKNIRRILSQENIEIVSLEQRKHIVIKGRTTEGAIVTITFPVTPSDGSRWENNMRSDIRRAARQAKERMGNADDGADKPY